MTGTAIDPGHSSSWPTGSNGLGAVVGGHSVGDNTHGFLWCDGTATDLGTLAGGDYSLANAINDSGLIVGSSELQPSGPQFRAVMWQHGVLSVLPTIAGSYYDTANLLNSEGDAAGYSVLSSGAQHAALWMSGAIQDLGPGRAVALDNSGQVLVQGVDSQGRTYPFIWDHGRKITFPATVTAASATSYGLAFVWDHGSVTQLLPASGGVAMPTAINGNGLVAGMSGLDTATVWQVP